MTGDFNVGANYLQIGASDIRLYNPTGKQLKAVRGAGLTNDVLMIVYQYTADLATSQEFRGRYNTSYLETRDVNDTELVFRSYTAGAYVEVGRLDEGSIILSQAGDIIPVSTKTKSLGSAAKYWNQLFVDAILCSNSIDMHPTAGDAVIYFKHDGAANEASLRYDKVNKRLELWIDGAIVGYCNAALGWVNGAP